MISSIKGKRVPNHVILFIYDKHLSTDMSVMLIHNANLNILKVIQV
jgi:hypothetical protein